MDVNNIYIFKLFQQNIISKISLKKATKGGGVSILFFPIVYAPVYNVLHVCIYDIFLKNYNRITV